MVNPKMILETEKELQEAILQEKARGTPDLVIGQKYGVTFRYIERLITRSQGINISAFKGHKKIKTLYPKDFKEEQTSVWSFKQRGSWATHSGEYRGNWSPYIPRNVILKYSEPGELVLDYFCGAGTTAVEAKLLGRRCVALDINDKAIELAKGNLEFEITPSQQLVFTEGKDKLQVYEPELLVGDARDLCLLGDSSVDLICAHPPYTNIIHYTDSKEGDLSFFDIEEFLKEMATVARESFRVLKPGRQCAILIGDMRRKKHVIPLGFKLINVYLDAGFKLRELVIKRQHNCKTTGFWYENSIKYNFLLLAHEYLPIFEKPESVESPTIKEKGLDYGVLVLTLEKPKVKRRLDELESTTVWVLPTKDFEERLNRNVIKRYSDGKGHSVINFSFGEGGESFCGAKGNTTNKNLLFVKSSFGDTPSLPKIKAYLCQLEEVITREAPTIREDGFIVIQTGDVRIDKYVEPLAKRIVDSISNTDLMLKEIVVVTQGNSCREFANYKQEKGHLKITHQYLLVYTKVR